MRLVSILQAGQQVAMADGMRSEGKIYVVLVGILLIFAGIVWYVYRLDRKVRSLSRKNQEKEHDTNHE